MKTTRISSLLSLAVVAVLAACSGDSPVAPTPRPLFETTASAVVVPGVPLKELYAQRDLLRAEQAAKKAALRAEYHRLLAQWGASYIKQRLTTPGALPTVLRCSPTEYAGTAEVIGPEGGQLTLGSSKLVVPKGALSRPTLLTMERPMGELAAATFGPHGLQFAAKAQLTLSYGVCSIPLGTKLRIVYASADGSKIYEVLSSTLNKLLSQVSAPIEHFSSYMIAY